MAYQMVTRTGRSFWEVTSVMQNAIRKGDFEIAGHAMWELLPQYTSYLCKRLLVISAEDCFGVITKEILPLCKEGDEDSLTLALALLCAAKKNRDADYFVCNLMEPLTKRVDDVSAVGQMLIRAIEDMDVVSAGLLSFTLFKKNRRFLWSVIEQYAKKERPHLMKEIEALHESNETVTKPNEETIFVAKAIVLIWTHKVPMERILACNTMRFDGELTRSSIPVLKKVEECKKVQGYFHEWAYNWHTSHGKYDLHRDAVHAIENDQRLLTPLEENLFDDCTWNKDINACLEKYNPRRRPLPYDDGKRKPEEKFGCPKMKNETPEQLSLFDM